MIRVLSLYLRVPRDRRLRVLPSLVAAVIISDARRSNSNPSHARTAQAPVASPSAIKRVSSAASTGTCSTATDQTSS